MGTGAAITAGDVVDLAVKGGERPTSIAAREVDALRGRYNDLHALGWWWVRKGAALPDPKNVKAAAVEGR